jgi:hypothetical protein
MGFGRSCCHTARTINAWSSGMDRRGDIDTIFKRLQRLAAAAGLPEIETGTHYGTPSLKVGGKAFVSIKNAETVVLSLPLDQKELLIEMAPDIYFQTDHYIGWPSLPLRIDAIGDEELQLRLTEAWRFRAPKKIRATFGTG